MNVNDLMTYIEPSLLVLVPFCWVVGRFLKDSRISNNIIPFILWGVSIVFSILYLTIVVKDVPSFRDIIIGTVQGTFIAALAVFGNQLMQQIKKDE